MKSNPGAFSAAASVAYKGLEESSRQNLIDLAEETGRNQSTSSDVRKSASKIFKRIDSQVLVACLFTIHTLMQIVFS